MRMILFRKHCNKFLSLVKFGNLHFNNRCEGARICLNNLGNLYNIEKARFFLKAALHFTP
jgi:hypothetical protein